MSVLKLNKEITINIYTEGYANCVEIEDESNFKLAENEIIDTNEVIIYFDDGSEKRFGNEKQCIEYLIENNLVYEEE